MRLARGPSEVRYAGQSRVRRVAKECAISRVVAAGIQHSGMNEEDEGDQGRQGCAVAPTGLADR